MITRDAFPYSALSLENFRFSFKARYVNDVHLPRFGCGVPGGRALPFSVEQHSLHATPYTEQPPVVRCTTGDSKDFSPSNANIIPKKRRRKLRHGDSDLLRGKRKDPQIGQLAHASHGVFRPKIVLPAASDAATGLVFQSTFGRFLSFELWTENSTRQRRHSGETGVRRDSMQTAWRVQDERP